MSILRLVHPDKQAEYKPAGMFVYLWLHFKVPFKTEENRVWNRIFYFTKLIINSSLPCSQAVIKAANPYVDV